MKENKNLEEIFQKIETSALLPGPVKEMGSEKVYFTGSIKYAVDFMEDCAQICNGHVENDNVSLRLVKGDVSIYYDSRSQVMYINQGAFNLIEKNKDSITFYLR